MAQPVRAHPQQPVPNRFMDMASYAEYKYPTAMAIALPVFGYAIGWLGAKMCLPIAPHIGGAFGSIYIGIAKVVDEAAKKVFHFFKGEDQPLPAWTFLSARYISIVMTTGLCHALGMPFPIKTGLLLWLSGLAGLSVIVIALIIMGLIVGALLGRLALRYA